MPTAYAAYKKVHQLRRLDRGVVAQRTITTLIDDIDGSEASETVVFGLDGTTYEVDLSEAHAEDLREVLSPYVSVARRAGSPAGGRSGRARATRPAASGDVDPKAVRAWAQANGVEVSARGRINSAVLEQYRTAHS